MSKRNLVRCSECGRAELGMFCGWHPAFPPMTRHLRSCGYWRPNAEAFEEMKVANFEKAMAEADFWQESDAQVEAGALRAMEPGDRVQFIAAEFHAICLAEVPTAEILTALNLARRAVRDEKLNQIFQ